METTSPRTPPEPSAPPAPRARTSLFSPGQWTLLLGVFAALLIARNPYVFITPQFWHEDYIIFFLEHREMGWSALINPTAGYHILFSRLVAAGADFFPLKFTPIIYTSMTLLGWLWAAALIFSSPIFSRRRWAVAAAFTLLIIPSNGEVFLVTCCMLWPFGAVLLLLLVEQPATKTSAAKSLFALLAGLTGPFSLILAPLAAWRGFRHYRAHRRVDMLALITLLCAAVQLASFSLTSQRAQAAAGVDPNILAFGLGLWVFPQIFGTYFGYPSDLLLRLLGTLLGVLGVLWIIYPRPGSSTRRLLLTGGGIALFVGFTVGFTGHGAFPHALGAGSRYYYVPCIAFIWGLLLTVAQGQIRRRELILPITLLGLILFRTSESPVAEKYEAPNWAQIVAAVEQGYRVEFPVPPYAFRSYLNPVSD